MIGRTQWSPNDAPPPRTDIPRKLATPRLGRAFDRERLFALLDSLSDSPAVWLGAPPGSGKTTLIATWLRRRKKQHFWFQLDAGDGDPATFVQSLDALLGSKHAVPIDLPAFRSDDLSDLQGWLRRRLMHLLPRMPARWILVLDNHQELPADSPIQAALAGVLAELPPGVQWIFISRQPPPPGCSFALAQQQLAVFEAENLCFDESETGALIRLHGRADVATAASLAAARGWAAGMTLMLLGAPREGAAPAIDARERMFDYFAGEVLSQMSPEEQQALCALAYLPGATAELAVAMSGYAPAPALLERLSAASLFTDRRKGPPVTFSFHDLFSEFLRKRFERLSTPQEVRRHWVHAGRLLAATGDPDGALKRMVMAGAWDDAESLISRFAARYADEGRTRALRQHIEALPPDTQARLAYWRGWCALDTDPAAALNDFTRAYEASAVAGDGNGQVAVAAAAATALIATGRLPELDRWIGVLDANASLVLRAHHDDIDGRLVPGMLAMLAYRAPWHSLIASLSERGEQLLHRESAAGEQLLLGSLAYHLLWRGQTDRLERLLLRIDALCAKGLAAPVTLMRWWSVGIVVKVLLGNHASAYTDAQQALALVERESSLAPRRASAELLAMLVALAMVDARAARRHLEKAARALHPDNAVDLTTYEHQRGILAFLEEDRPAALRLMRAAVESANTSGFPMREHIALIAQALAAAHCDEHEEAGQLLERVVSHRFFTIGGWHNWVAGLVAAYAALRRDDAAATAHWLRLALRVARECGFRYGPMLFCCGEMQPRLMAFALAHGIEPDVARDVIVRHQLKAPPEADAAWPWAVRVRVLGLLEVEVGGKPMPASRKESRRLLELLCVLAAGGTRPASIEAVADELWPDADGDAARNALDNALHRLRKVLGGDDRILLRQGALLLNPQRCWTDVCALESLLIRLETAPPAMLPELVGRVGQLYGAPLSSLAAPDGLVALRLQALQRQVQRALRSAGERMRGAGIRPPGSEDGRSDESLPNP